MGQPPPLGPDDYVAEYLFDWSTPPAGELLDHVADAVVRTVGSEAFEPLGRRFDDAVGRPREDDDDFALLQAIRSDWVVCEASISGTPGDSWAWRAARGEVAELGGPEVRAVAASFTGLFEIWPGRTTWVRDRLRGLCLPLADPPEGIEAAQQASALWELRLLPSIDGTPGVRLGRRPLEYPMSLLSRLESSHGERWTAHGGLDLMVLRRARLAWVRGRKVGGFARYLDREL